MSHQRYPSIDPVKEPHSISLKVLRLSRPSLVSQYPISPPLSPEPSRGIPPSIPASVAYPPSASSSSLPSGDRNPSPFLLSPILNLPVSFGSAYVGETFSCTLCANNDLPAPDAAQPSHLKVHIRDVKIEAEMKTPGTGATLKLEGISGQRITQEGSSGVDLDNGGTFQKVVRFDLKEEGNHVLAVTVSYYEATETSGRTRTFRKLYQFVCKPSLIVRTKVGSLERKTKGTKKVNGEEGDEVNSKNGGGSSGNSRRTAERRRWVLEAQLENCSEEVMQLEKIAMDVEDGIESLDCNWEVTGSEKPILHPGEVEQVCFVVEEKKPEGEEGGTEAGGHRGLKVAEDGRIIFGVLGIGWRGEMGNKGFLSTGKLGARVAR